MHKRIMWGALAMGVAGAAAAQGTPPPPEYRSAFADYRPYKEPVIVDWRAANEEVGRVGGHLGIVRGQKKDAGKDKPKPPTHGMQHK